MLTTDTLERVALWDRREGPELQLVIGGTSLVVLSRGEAAEKVIAALRPILGEIAVTPVAIEEPPPPPRVVPVATGLHSAGVRDE